MNKNIPARQPNFGELLLKNPKNPDSKIQQRLKKLGLRMN